MVDVPIPGLKLTTLNAREHYMAKARRVKVIRNWVTLVLRGTVARDMTLVAPLVVTITRVGPRRLDDDNATGSAKPVRDAVAAVLGVDDGDPRVTWKVEQAKGPYATRVRIEPREQAHGE